MSATTVWEIAIKATKGKLHAPYSLERAVLESGFTPLAVTLGHGERAGSLPLLHKDPFDRLLVAQAQAEHLEILTLNAKLRSYDMNVITA